MTTRTVGDERMESKRELEATKEELDAAMEKYAAAAGRESAGGALPDRRIRGTVLSSARRGLEAVVRRRPDGGAANAPACAACGGPTRYLRRGDAPVESALGRVEVPMGRYACDACGTSARSRERALDIVGSMTPTARRCPKFGERSADSPRMTTSPTAFARSRRTWWPARARTRYRPRAASRSAGRARFAHALTNGHGIKPCRRSRKDSISPASPRTSAPKETCFTFDTSRCSRKPNSCGQRSWSNSGRDRPASRTGLCRSSAMPRLRKLVELECNGRCTEERLAVHGAERPVVGHSHGNRVSATSCMQRHAVVHGVAGRPKAPCAIGYQQGIDQFSPIFGGPPVESHIDLEAFPVPCWRFARGG